MKSRLIAVILTIVITGCKTGLKEPPKDYKLIEEDGIFVEVFDSTNVKPNRFTDNNTVYKKGLEFIYSYEHITKNNNKYFFKEDPSIEGWKNSWKFVAADSIDDNTTLEVKIKIREGLEPMIKYNKDYNQTVAQYECLNKDKTSLFNSASGIIENEKNVWMHPPRDKYFRILELNPFPYIQTPFKVGNKWEWSLKIGDYWSDKRWLAWKGEIENKCVYEITDKKKVPMAFGILECYVIDSHAKSRLGTTQLQALYHEKYGFVQLNYINIDGSRTNLELIEVVDK